jgi:hypothetical protein
MTIKIGRLHRESFGSNAFSADCFIGQAAWQTLEPTTLPTMPDGLFSDYPDGHCVEFPELQVLQVSVPPNLLWAACASANTRPLASFLPWKDSGIVVVTLAKADEALLVALDLAGRTDMQALQTAGAEGRVAAALCTAGELDICPMLKVVGVHEAVAEASTHRRLAARELVAAIEDLRWIFQTDGVFGLLGLPPREGLLKSLTLNVCLPL